MTLRGILSGLGGFGPRWSVGWVWISRLKIGPDITRGWTKLRIFDIVPSPILNSLWLKGLVGNFHIIGTMEWGCFSYWGDGTASRFQWLYPRFWRFSVWLYPWRNQQRIVYPHSIPIARWFPLYIPYTPTIPAQKYTPMINIHHQLDGHRTIEIWIGSAVPGICGYNMI